MHRIFSRRLGYLAVAIQVLLISISVHSADLQQNYFYNYDVRNGKLCKGSSCPTSPAKPFGQDSQLNVASVNITVHNSNSGKNIASPVYNPPRQQRVDPNSYTQDYNNNPSGQIVGNSYNQDFSPSNVNLNTPEQQIIDQVSSTLNFVAKPADGQAQYNYNYNNDMDKYYSNDTVIASYSSLQPTHAEGPARKEDYFGNGFGGLPNTNTHFGDLPNTNAHYGDLPNTNTHFSDLPNVNSHVGEIPNVKIQKIKTDYELHLTPGVLHVVVIVVAIIYIIIGLLAKVNVLSLQDSLIPCLGPHAEEFPISYIHSENAVSTFISQGDPKLQQDLFDMFTSYGGGGNSGEDNSGEFPDLGGLSNMCPKNAFFYGMNPQHKMAIDMLQNMLMGQPDAHSMMGMAKALRHNPNVNPKVWYTAMMNAAMLRPDMKGMIMPGPLDAMPDTFIPGTQVGRTLANFRSSRQSRSHNKHKQKCVRVDGSVGKDNGHENSLWYFREDVMVNSHHWYWHLSYPLMTKLPLDRRGELFYYSHGSMVTRYNIERLSHGMDFAVPLDVFPDAPIHEGYNAHLTDLNSGMHWTDRPPYTPFTDIIHYDNPSSRSAFFLEPWLESRDRILKSVHHGLFLTRKGIKLPIPRLTGINMLGNTLEANDESVNPVYYTPDGYHNTGHRIIGYLADPHYQFRLPPGPMGDPATAMRDPVFYRWHTNIHNIFSAYKSTLKPYQPIGGDFPLLWNGIEVKEISVVTKHGSHNDLKTFWNHRKFPLSLGLAFNISGDDHDDFDEHLDVCATHLDHEEFEYNIHINRRPCANSKTHSATVRVFIAPRYDIHGKRFTMKQQRRLFVHLDLFRVNLKVGRNIITRHSKDSTLTIPFVQSLSQLQATFRNGGSPNCGCGWPHHLLLPKGTPDGMAFDLFVMVTNGDHDFVADGHTNPFEEQCASNFIYCGIQNRRYPDARPMGYPFDREVYKVSPHCTKGGHSIWSKICSIFSLDWRAPEYLEEYTWGIPNMAFSKISITHVPK